MFSRPKFAGTNSIQVALTWNRESEVLRVTFTPEPTIAEGVRLQNQAYLLEFTITLSTSAESAKYRKWAQIETDPVIVSRFFRDFPPARDADESIFR